MSESEGELMPAPLDPERRQRLRVDAERSALAVQPAGVTVHPDTLLALLDECDRLCQVVADTADTWESEGYTAVAAGLRSVLAAAPTSRTEEALTDD